MGQAGLLTQAPPSTLWVNNGVDQNTHMFGHGVRTPLSQEECCFAAEHDVTLFQEGNAALSKSGPFNPVRAALCESWSGVSGSVQSLDTVGSLKELPHWDHFLPESYQRLTSSCWNQQFQGPNEVSHYFPCGNHRFGAISAQTLRIKAH